MIIPDPILLPGLCLKEDLFAEIRDWSEWKWMGCVKDSRMDNCLSGAGREPTDKFPEYHPQNYLRNEAYLIMFIAGGIRFN